MAHDHTNCLVADIEDRLDYLATFFELESNKVKAGSDDARLRLLALGLRDTVYGILRADFEKLTRDDPEHARTSGLTVPTETGEEFVYTSSFLDNMAAGIQAEREALNA